MGFMNTLKTALRQRTRGEAELGYLNEATTVTDLEMRQREIDRGRFRNLPHRR